MAHSLLKQINTQTKIERYCADIEGWLVEKHATCEFNQSKLWYLYRESELCTVNNGEGTPAGITERYEYYIPAVMAVHYCTDQWCWTDLHGLRFMMTELNEPHQYVVISWGWQGLVNNMLHHSAPAEVLAFQRTSGAMNEKQLVLDLHICLRPVFVLCSTDRRGHHTLTSNIRLLTTVALFGLLHHSDCDTFPCQ